MIEYLTFENHANPITEAQVSGYILKYFLISKERLIANVKDDIIKSNNFDISSDKANFIANQFYEAIESATNQVRTIPPEPEPKISNKRRWSM